MSSLEVSRHQSSKRLSMIYGITVISITQDPPCDLLPTFISTLVSFGSPDTSTELGHANGDTLDSHLSRYACRGNPETILFHAYPHSWSPLNNRYDMARFHGKADKTSQTTASQADGRTA